MSAIRNFMSAAAKKKGKYGIKAYGGWDFFTSRAKYEEYLMDWICATEGAERDRAVMALENLRAGIFLTDTDNDGR